MSQRKGFGLVVGTSLLIAVYVLAQQEPASNSQISVPGRYAVAAGADAAILLDTVTGRTWTLARSADDDRVWLPAQRIESEDERLRWRHGQLAQQEELERRALELQRARIQAAK